MGIPMTKIIADYLDDTDYNPSFQYSKVEKLLIIQGLKYHLFKIDNSYLRKLNDLDSLFDL